MGAEVNFIGAMLLKTHKKYFLSNSKNKQRLIDMLSAGLRDNDGKT